MEVLEKQTTAFCYPTIPQIEHTLLYIFTADHMLCLFASLKKNVFWRSYLIRHLDESFSVWDQSAYIVNHIAQKLSSLESLAPYLAL